MFDAKAANRKRVIPRAEPIVKAKAQELSYKTTIYSLYLVLTLRKGDSLLQHVSLQDFR